MGWGDSWGDDWGSTGTGTPTGAVATDYLGLITSEYQLSPNWLALLAACLQKLEDVNQVLMAMNATAFDLGSAVGVQLDLLGTIIGVSRTVDFQPSNSVSPILDDNTYRILLQATVINNQWDGKIESLYSAWQTLFPGGKILVNDAQNMSAVITVSGTFSSIIVDLINNGYIVPRPQAVEYTYGFGTLPYLGFDENNSYVGGLDTGYFI